MRNVLYCERLAVLVLHTWNSLCHNHCPPVFLLRWLSEVKIKIILYHLIGNSFNVNWKGGERNNSLTFLIDRPLKWMYFFMLRAKYSCGFFGPQTTKLFTIHGSWRFSIILLSVGSNIFVITHQIYLICRPTSCNTSK